MGLSELVLKVPADLASRPPAGAPPTATTAASTASTRTTSAENTTLKTGLKPKQSSLKKNKKPAPVIQRSKTHSRESSGASNLSVKFSVTDETASVSASTATTNANSKLVSHRRNSEDGTLSDRLSQDLYELDDDDGFHQSGSTTSKSCESILHNIEDRLTPDSVDSVDVDATNHGIRIMPGDSKSQNSDYGSFCHTPSDTFGTLAAQEPPEGDPPDQSVGASKMLASPSTNPDSDQVDHGPGGDTQTQPLLPTDTNDYSSSEDDAGANSSGYMRRKPRIYRHQPVQVVLDTPDSVDENDLDDHPEVEIKGEPIKTLLAFLFLIFAWVATTTSLALTHERLPDYKPLPDIFLDNIKYQPWGLDASEIVIMISTMMAFVVTLFHKHRSIVLRRLFLLVGIHYYYRAVTMYVTVLPKPNEHYECAPKSPNTTALVIFQRVLKLLSGMGLTINGKHIYCGDYIYSGHTMTLLMTYLVIKEYSPRNWFLLHWFSLCTTIFGILALLLARGHYSIDVVIAYWITTRMWWLYHTMANHENLKATNNSSNYMAKVWWWYIFRYFEGQVPICLPRQYGWPLPEKLLQWNIFRRRTLNTEQDSSDAESGQQQRRLNPSGD